MERSRATVGQAQSRGTAEGSGPGIWGWKSGVEVGVPSPARLGSHPQPHPEGLEDRGVPFLCCQRPDAALTVGSGPRKGPPSPKSWLSVRVGHPAAPIPAAPGPWDSPTSWQPLLVMGGRGGRSKEPARPQHQVPLLSQGTRCIPVGKETLSCAHPSPAHGWHQLCPHGWPGGGTQARPASPLWRGRGEPCHEFPETQPASSQGPSQSQALFRTPVPGPQAPHGRPELPPGREPSPPRPPSPLPLPHSPSRPLSAHPPLPLGEPFPPRRA